LTKWDKKKEQMIIKIEPIYNKRIRELCLKPYYNHPKGCPNYNKKLGCPPRAPMIYDSLDLLKPVFAIYNVFNLAEHMYKMSLKHPGWSERQLKCCLYWQPKARKQLKMKIYEFLKLYKNYKIITCPEAQGVNLTETMFNVEIILEWMPETAAYQIVLGGIDIIDNMEG